MVDTQVVQWVSIGVAVVVFFYRQTKIAGRYEERLDSFKKSSTKQLDALMDRIEKLEVRAYGNGEGGFLTMRQHDKIQADCQAHFSDQIGQTQELFERMADRIDRMDASRDETRKEADKRLRLIETSLVSIASDVKYLTKSLAN